MGLVGGNRVKETYEFTAEIKKVPDLNGAYAEVPLDIRNVFGKGRLKVLAVFDGIEYEGSIVNVGIKNADGSIGYIIGMPKDIRKKIGKEAGDTVQVSFTVIESH